MMNQCMGLETKKKLLQVQHNITRTVCGSTEFDVMLTSAACSFHLLSLKFFHQSKWKPFSMLYDGGVLGHIFFPLQNFFHFIYSSFWRKNSFVIFCCCCSLTTMHVQFSASFIQPNNHLYILSFELNFD